MHLVLSIPTGDPPATLHTVAGAVSVTPGSGGTAWRVAAAAGVDASSLESFDAGTELTVRAFADAVTAALRERSGAPVLDDLPLGRCAEGAVLVVAPVDAARLADEIRLGERAIAGTMFWQLVSSDVAYDAPAPGATVLTVGATAQGPRWRLTVDADDGPVAVGDGTRRVLIDAFRDDDKWFVSDRDAGEIPVDADADALWSILGGEPDRDVTWRRRLGRDAFSETFAAVRAACVEAQRWDRPLLIWAAEHRPEPT